MVSNTEQKQDRAVKELIEKVILEDFPFIEISQIAGYSVKKDSITGQFIEKNSNFVFNFSFGEDELKPVLQRFI